MASVEIIGPCHILAPNRWQPITRTKDYHDYWRHMASLGHIAVTVSYNDAHVTHIINIFFVLCTCTLKITALSVVDLFGHLHIAYDPASRFNNKKIFSYQNIFHIVMKNLGQHFVLRHVQDKCTVLYISPGLCQPSRMRMRIDMTCVYSSLMQIHEWYMRNVGEVSLSRTARAIWGYPIQSLGTFWVI